MIGGRRTAAGPRGRRLLWAGGALLTALASAALVVAGGAGSGGWRPGDWWPAWPASLTATDLAAALVAAALSGGLGWWAGRRLLMPARTEGPLNQPARRARAGAAGEAGPAGRGFEPRVGPAPLDVDTDAILRVSHLQRIILFNRSAERLFGYTGGEAMGQDLDLVLPVETPGARRPHIRDLAHRAERREVVGRRRDGTLFTAEAGVSARSRDGQTAYTVVLRDVTERKRAEAALRESEARFRGAFEHSAAGMALEGPDGTLTRVNRTLGEMLGYAEAELLGRTHPSLFHANDTSSDDWYERDLRSGSIRWYQREQRYQHRDGHAVWGLLSVSAVQDPDGRITDFLIQVQDITERKRAEALEVQLRHTQRIEAVGRLAAGVAHDFNNLLMVITGRSHILLHRLPGSDPRRRHVELIQSTALRAGALTRQLLAFSRKTALRPTVLDPHELVADLAPMLRRLLGEQVLLETAPGPGLGRVRADRGQIEQVILNLSVNARDAMPEGGRLTLGLADVELSPDFVAQHPGARPGWHVALTVRDTGIGMDADTRSRLFEPFFTTKEPGQGTGLGLAMVYGIVKESDGYIDVESQPGQGATFTVYLPRVDEAVAAPEPSLSVGDLPRGSETVLLVEDEEAVRDLTREILQQAGYTVLGARHGGEALLLGDRHGGPIHLVVTDVVMPEVGGPRLVERVAATRPDVKVLYMSGYTDEALEPYGVLTSGAFLRKPITPDTLVRKVREVLDARA